VNSASGAEPLRVVAFVERYLEPEQTFIYRQMTELPRCNVRFAARFRLSGNPYPDDSVVWLGAGESRLAPRLLWRLSRARQLLTRRYRWLSRAERARLSAVLDSFAPHIVHAHWGPDAMLVSPVCAARSIPLVVHFHGYDVSRLATDGVYLESLKRLFDEMAVAITVSDAMRHRVMELGCAPERVRRHYTGVPEPYFSDRDRLPPSANRAPVLLQVGRLAAVKGHEVSLRAFARLRVPGAKLRIAGDGHMREALERQITALGLAGRTELLGRVPPSEVLQHMLNADALLLPSLTAPDGGVEGLPNVAVEAMACGLPVIATRHGGIPEAVRYSEPDWLVAEGDVEGLHARSERLLSEPALWRRLSGEGRAIARRDFHLPTQNGRLRALYEELVEARR
jgi:glycosyltransferase involved in cell wall biosynthesis